MEDGGANVEKETTKTLNPDFLLQWSQWQLLDSILPTGGFAHSFGLEAAVQARIILDPTDLNTLVIHILENTGSLLLPFVYAASISPDADSCKRLDRVLDAMLTNEVSRKASISQGSALMRAAAAIFTEFPSLKTMRDRFLGSAEVSFHHAPVFGMVCGLVGMDSETCQRAYLFITMRDAISAATRLNLVGPLGAAVLQHQMSGVAETILKRWKNHSVDEACQTAPVLDTLQGCHSYLYSRLFCS
ncbi:urease accessory protein F [Euphorbia peplus]|nr:urease accessory protein F [Euphorbia peplus]